MLLSDEEKNNIRDIFARNYLHDGYKIADRVLYDCATSFVRNSITNEQKAIMLTYQVKPYMQYYTRFFHLLTGVESLDSFVLDLFQNYVAQIVQNV